MLLSKRPKDDDSAEGFTKWPFMTTHIWAEVPRGVWTMFVIFDSDEPQEGAIMEWTLVLHGTKTSSYVGQGIDLEKRHPKLEVVKREHEHGVNFQF